MLFSFQLEKLGKLRALVPICHPYEVFIDTETSTCAGILISASIFKDRNEKKESQRIPLSKKFAEYLLNLNLTFA